MTARSLDPIWSLPGDILMRFQRGSGLEAQPLSLVEETVILRGCAQYRRAFRGTAVSYPADALGYSPVANWIRRNRVTVDLRSAHDLGEAISVGILLPHRVIHCRDLATALLHCAVNTGSAKFVVDAVGQVEQLASGLGRTRQVVVDVTDSSASALIDDVIGQRRLGLIGLHRRVNEADETDLAAAVRDMIAQMSAISRRRQVILTRVSLADVDCGADPRSLRRYASTIHDAVETACIQYRYPRPALTVAPSRAALGLH